MTEKSVAPTSAPTAAHVAPSSAPTAAPSRWGTWASYAKSAVNPMTYLNLAKSVVWDLPKKAVGGAVSCVTGWGPTEVSNAQTTVKTETAGNGVPATTAADSKAPADTLATEPASPPLITATRPWWQWRTKYTLNSANPFVANKEKRKTMLTNWCQTPPSLLAFLEGCGRIFDGCSAEEREKWGNSLYETFKSEFDQEQVKAFEGMFSAPDGTKPETIIGDPKTAHTTFLKGVDDGTIALSQGDNNRLTQFCLKGLQTQVEYLQKQVKSLTAKLENSCNPSQAGTGRVDF